MDISKKQRLPSEIISIHRQEILDLLDSYKASNIQVFGSVARSQDKVGSDIDLLVELPSGMSLLQRIDIEQRLSDICNCSFDVVKPNEIPNGIKERILAEARPL